MSRYKKLLEIKHELKKADEELEILLKQTQELSERNPEDEKMQSIYHLVDMVCLRNAYTRGMIKDEIENIIRSN